MRLILAGLVTIAGLVPWVLYLRTPVEARSKAGRMLAVPPAAALVVLLLAPDYIHRTTAGSIGLGLILTLIGSILIHNNFLPPYAGYAHLLIAYALYGAGFAIAAGGVSLTPWLLLPLLIAAAATYHFYRRLRELWGTLMIGGGILLLALWPALSMAVAAPSNPSGWLATAGLALIALIHLGELLRAYAPLPWLRRYPEQAYSLPAHLLLAWSAWGNFPPFL